MTDGGETVWLPYPPNRVPGLPTGLSYAGRDGSAALPGDPGDVRFLVGERVLTAPGTRAGEQAA
ncbi:hypothetical protein ABTX77_30405 [Streptomyces sp. NPDC097704]|uniref:hypothetical protein n=1 Tax=Streptomyces sp. NPDC097704 TaxID=3157101 RepID=UPI00331BA082